MKFTFYILALIWVLHLLGCSNADPTEAKNEKAIKPSESQDVAISNVSASRTPTKIAYEILRRPTGGNGVFDLGYNVYVKKTPTEEECDYIFQDIIKLFGRYRYGNKDIMSISIWTNKAAFAAEMKFYQQEDKDFDDGKDIHKYGKLIQDLEKKYGKFEVAEYSDDGYNPVTITYPKDKN